MKNKPQYRLKIDNNKITPEYKPQKRFFYFFWIDLDEYIYTDERRARDAIDFDKQWYARNSKKFDYKYYF